MKIGFIGLGNMVPQWRKIWQRPVMRLSGWTPLQSRLRGDNRHNRYRGSGGADVVITMLPNGAILRRGG